MTINYKVTKSSDDGMPDDEDNSLVGLMETLASVDENGPDAKLNQATISDNNGGRIKLNEKDSYQDNGLIQGV